MYSVAIVCVLAFGVSDIDVSQPPFNIQGDGVTDCTEALQSVADAAAFQQVTDSNGFVKAQTAPRIYFPSGIYKISGPINFKSVATIAGSKAIIVQTANTRSFVFGRGTHVDIDGMKFVGGTNAVYIANQNINACMFNISRCHFDRTTGAAILAESTATDANSVGVLSATLNIDECRFRDCYQMLDECCDFANFYSCQVQMSIVYATPVPKESGYLAFIVVRRGCFQIRDTVLTPADFVYSSTSGPIKHYWIYSTGSVLASETRFGGENGGIPILMFGPAGVNATNNNGRSVRFIGCQMCAGPTSVPSGTKTPNTTTAMITLNGMPSLIEFNNNYVMFVAPHILDPSGNAAKAAATMNIAPKIRFGVNVNFPDTIRIPSTLTKYVVK